MNKFTLSAASLLIATFFAHSAFALDKDAVAAVNGKKITQQEYQQHLKLISMQRQQQGNQAPLNRQAVLNDLINKEILVQEAKKKKLDKDKNVKAQLQRHKENLMVQALLAKSPAAKPVTDKELQDFYDKKIKNADRSEYKTRHIQVKDEAKARELIKKLNDGADFAETAKNESTDPSGKTGGDLGWLSPVQMPPAFSKAIANQMKGTHSQAPVKTKFGYHIIKLEDSRQRELPKFEDVKEQIRPAIQNKRLQDYMMKLRNQAKIEIK